jgi:hypothetical protein
MIGVIKPIRKLKPSDSLFFRLLLSQRTVDAREPQSKIARVVNANDCFMRKEKPKNSPAEYFRQRFILGLNGRSES